jgi:hypothetical protein
VRGRNRFTTDSSKVYSLIGIGNSHLRSFFSSLLGKADALWCEFPVSDKVQEK